MTHPDAFAIVKAELLRAQQLHAPMPTAHHGLDVIREEFQELEQEVRKKDNSRDMDAMQREASHVATTAIRFMIDVCGVPQGDDL